MEILTIEKLNEIYSDSENVDQALFSEMRSNVLLTLGEHYNKKNSKYWSRIRDTNSLHDEQKIRITKNHIQKVMKSYINNIISYAPGVMPVPKNDKELSDTKAAELNRSIWQDICEKHKMDDQVFKDAQDFNVIGEVCQKLFWDPAKGKFLGWQQSQDVMGEPEVDENGNPKASDVPVYTGDLVFERVYGFNLLRSASCKDMEQNEVWIVRKMVDKESMKKMLDGEPEKKKFLESSYQDSYLVFEGVNGGYKKSDNEILVREFYFKPCYKYPNGYFYITTEAGILWSGELPIDEEGPIWPIVYTGFDSAQTTPRHYSQIKQIRSSQIEANRMASAKAQAGITTGDDKLLYQAGTKLSPGALLPGIRGIQYSGIKPEVMEGRTGSQYDTDYDKNVSELYQLSNINEDEEESLKQADPFGMLFFSLRDKKKFSLYATKFERFQVEKCKLALRLAKAYYTEEMIVPAIGRNEIVNIAEFKNTNPLCYEIKLKPQVNDIESMFGRQLVMNTALQYVGQKLDKEDIGRIIRNMPFANAEKSFEDLTMNYDTATNIILALDRGEMPEMVSYADNKYILKRLTSRTVQADFKYFSPEIKQMYQQVIKSYEQKEAEELRKIKEAESELIPAGGAKVAVDYYVTDPTSPNKVTRAKLPAEAVNWLIEKLSKQGSSQENLRRQSQGAQAEIAGLVRNSLGIPPETQRIPSPQTTAFVQPRTA